MPPDKAKSLFAQLRKQSKQAIPFSQPDSAFAKLSRGGKKRAYTDSDEEKQKVPETQSKRTKKAMPKKAIKSKTKEPTPEPVIESWRPAGGEALLDDELFGSTATDTLGLARISSWRMANFQTAAVKLIKKHGGFEKAITHRVEHGNEDLTDVYFKFRSELEAELMKTKIEDAMVAGQKVNVMFAQDDDLAGEGDWKERSARSWSATSDSE